MTQQGKEMTGSLYSVNQYGTSRTVSSYGVDLYFSGSSVNKRGSSIKGNNLGASHSITTIGSQVTGLYQRNSAGDTTVPLRGTEEKTALYTRDSSKDETFSAIGDQPITTPFYRDTAKDIQRRLATEQLTFKPATISTQRLTALTT